MAIIEVLDYSLFESRFMQLISDTTKTAEDWKSLRLTKAIYAHIKETEIFIVFETRIAGSRVRYAERYPTPFKIRHYYKPEGLEFSSLMLDNYLSSGIVRYLKDITHISIYHNNRSENSEAIGLRAVTTEIKTKKGSFNFTEYFETEKWSYLSSNSVNVLYED